MDLITRGDIVTAVLLRHLGPERSSLYSSPSELQIAFVHSGSESLTEATALCGALQLNTVAGLGAFVRSLSSDQCGMPWSSYWIAFLHRLVVAWDVMLFDEQIRLAQCMGDVGSGSAAGMQTTKTMSFTDSIQLSLHSRNYDKVIDGIHEMYRTPELMLSTMTHQDSGAGGISQEFCQLKGAAQLHLATALLTLNYPHRARQCVEDALLLAREHNLPAFLMLARMVEQQVYFALGDIPGTLDCLTAWLDVGKGLVPTVKAAAYATIAMLLYYHDIPYSGVLALHFGYHNDTAALTESTVGGKDEAVPPKPLDQKVAVSQGLAGGVSHGEEPWLLAFRCASIYVHRCPTAPPQVRLHLLVLQLRSLLEFCPGPDAVTIFVNTHTARYAPLTLGEVATRYFHSFAARLLYGSHYHEYTLAQQYRATTDETTLIYLAALRLYHAGYLVASLHLLERTVRQLESTVHSHSEDMCFSAEIALARADVLCALGRPAEALTILEASQSFVLGERRMARKLGSRLSFAVAKCHMELGRKERAVMKLAELHASTSNDERLSVEVSLTLALHTQGTTSPEIPAKKASFYQHHPSLAGLMSLVRGDPVGAAEHYLKAGSLHGQYQAAVLLEKLKGDRQTRERLEALVLERAYLFPRGTGPHAEVGQWVQAADAVNE